MNDNATFTGILGTTTSFTGFMVSMMPQIETGLRVGGLPLLKGLNLLTEHNL
jgi:hypothetical protein